MYLGTQPAIGQNRKLDSIAASFNGVLTTFSLTVNTQSVVPSNVYQLFISLGGVLQDPGVDFTANGNQITFTTAPVSGLSFFGVFQGDSITGTPTIADASITTLKLATGLTITNTAGTAGAPSVTFAGDTNTGIYSPGADQVAITTGGTGRLFIDSSGRLLVGTSTARSNFFGTTLSSLTQTEGTGGSTARGSLSVINNDVSNNPPYVLLGRSGAATLGSNAAVVSGSRLGTLTFHGADGTSFIEAATVAGEVDGTPGANDMPGRLVFSTTADGAASPTERLRITSAGLVGIGTTSPSAPLHINGTANNTAITLSVAGTVTGYIGPAGFLGGSDSSLGYRAETGNNHAFFIGASEAARIDSSRRLLVGTTTSTNNIRENQTLALVAQGTNTYAGLGATSYAGATQVAAPMIDFNRSRGTTDGVMTSVASGDRLGWLSFRGADGTAFRDAAAIYGEVDGTPGASDMPGRLVFSTTADGAASPTERLHIKSNTEVQWRNVTEIFPFTDNSCLLGKGSFRWSAVWAANGTIQTSDQRAKSDITDAQLGSEFIKNLRPVSYKWIEGGRRHTGEYDGNGNCVYESVAGTRTHWGFIAQEVKQAVDNAGVDFGGWVLTDNNDPDSQQALRYDQFIAPLTKALQEALAEIDVLKAKVAALEGA